MNSNVTFLSFQETETRLLGQDLQISFEIAKLLPQNIIHSTDQEMSETATDLTGFYKSDVSSLAELKSEMRFWKKYCATSEIAEMNSLEALKATEEICQNLHKLFRILATLPISTATAERSFSYLRIIKNYLRNSMKQERLSGLALMYMNETNGDSVKMDSQIILDKWYSKRNRRIDLKSVFVESV